MPKPHPQTLASVRNDPRLQAVFKSPVPPVVIFPVSHAGGLSVIRTLEDEGMPILALDFKSQAAGLYSNRATSLLIPDMYADPQTFEAFMLELGSCFEQRPVLFLVDDEDLFLSLKRQPEWEKVYRLPLSPWNIVNDIVDKGRMYRKLQGLNWKHCPRTWFANDMEALRALRGQVAFPCIVKPTFSTAFRQTFGFKAKKFDAFDALEEFGQKVFDAGIEFVVQEFIPGPEESLVTYAAYSNEQGEVLSSFTGRKVHQFPPDFGTCRLGESICDPELERVGREYLKILNYRGISLTEFKRTDDGSFKVIELNPRPGDWPERLAQLCGANLVLTAYRDTLGQAVKPHAITRYGVKWANLPEDFYYCVRGYRLLGYTEAHRGLFGWLSDLRGLASDAFFSWRDPLPFWIRFKGMLRDFRSRERQLRG